MTQGKTYNKSPRRINHKATKSKTNTGTTALQRSVRQKSRECHNHKPQPFPDPKRKRKRVALWFILRGDLMYVFPCVILFLCFSVLVVLRLPRLGKRELILVLFVRLFGLCLFRFVGFLFLLGSGKGCGVWLLHSLDFSLTFFGPTPC